MYYVKNYEHLYQFGIQLIQLIYKMIIKKHHINICRESLLEYAIQKCKSTEICEYRTETKYDSPFTNTSHKPSYNHIEHIYTSITENIQMTHLVDTQQKEDVPLNLLQKNY